MTSIISYLAFLWAAMEIKGRKREATRGDADDVYRVELEFIVFVHHFQWRTTQLIELKIVKVRMLQCILG